MLWFILFSWLEHVHSHSLSSVFRCKFRPKKVSSFWSSVGFKISAVTCFYLFFWVVLYFFIFFWPTGKYVIHVIRRYQISHNIQSMVSKRGLTNWANIHTHMWKTQHGRIPIDPAILAAIGHHFTAKKRKFKMLTHGSEAPRLFDIIIFKISIIILFSV